jgi:hypothetical protein
MQPTWFDTTVPSSRGNAVKKLKNVMSLFVIAVQSRHQRATCPEGKVLNYENYSTMIHS